MTDTAIRDRIVRVASGQGFWGDWLEAPRRQVEGGDVDYLMLDYLAEVTMSILQKQKERDPNMGYARDFVGAIESVLPAVAHRGVRVIANAGGVNPPACAAAIRGVAQKAGVSDKVQMVEGDANLQDALIEMPHLTIFRPPQAFECLVLLEVLAAIELGNPLEEQNWRRFVAGRHQQV